MSTCVIIDINHADMVMENTGEQLGAIGILRFVRDRHIEIIYIYDDNHIEALYDYIMRAIENLKNLIDGEEHLEDFEAWDLWEENIKTQVNKIRDSIASYLKINDDPNLFGRENLNNIWVYLKQKYPVIEN